MLYQAIGLVINFQVTRRYSFVRIQHFLIWAVNFTPFVDPEILLLYLHSPATAPSVVSEVSSLYPSTIFLQDPFSINFPSMPMCYICVLLSTTKKMQHFIICFIIVYALYFSGSFSAHHQELKNCIHSIWYVPGLPDTYQIPPETCRAQTTIKNIIKGCSLLVVLKRIY